MTHNFLVWVRKINQIPRRPSNKLLGLRLFAECPLHRGADWLIGTMNAADPAAGATLAFEQLFAGSFNAPVTGFNLLGVFNPTNKLVSGQRRNVFPEG